MTEYGKFLMKVTIRTIINIDNNTTKIIDVTGTEFYINLPISIFKKFLDLHGVNYLFTYSINSEGKNIVLSCDKVKNEYHIRTIMDVVKHISMGEENV